MSLSRTEEWLLRRYTQYAERPPTYGTLLRGALPQLLVIAGLGAAGACVLFAADEPLGASFAVGFAFGAIVRQLAQLRVAAVAAPVLSRIIDQDRVQRLLSGSMR